MLGYKHICGTGAPQLAERWSQTSVVVSEITLKSTFVLANFKENIKSPHYRTFVRGWTVDYAREGPVMQNIQRNQSEKWCLSNSGHFYPPQCVKTYLRPLPMDILMCSNQCRDLQCTAKLWKGARIPRIPPVWMHHFSAIGLRSKRGEE